MTKTNFTDVYQKIVDLVVANPDDLLFRICVLLKQEVYHYDWVGFYILDPINNELILDGSATDVWVFQIAGTLTQATGVQITLLGGASAENIFWVVANSVSIGVGAHVEGTIIAA